MAADRNRSGPSEAFWLGVFSLGAATGVFATLLIPVFETWAQAAGPGASAAATALGAAMARRMARAGVTGTAFVKATTTTRALAGSWILLSVVVLGGSLVGAAFNGNVFRSAGFIVGAFGADLSALVGLGSLLLVIGPGYGEYRTAMSPEGDETPER